TAIPIPPLFTTVAEAVAGLSALEEVLYSRRDRRGVFVTAYLLITKTLQAWIIDGRFADDKWTERYLLALANLYRQALEAYEAQHRENVPKAWQQSLDTSRSGLALIIQDLILGINAHINRDLPFALVKAGIEKKTATRYQDHLLVNDALRETTDVVQDRIAA